MKQQTTNTREDDRIVRILSKDIEGKMKIYAGLTQVKGISWTTSRAICKSAGIDKDRKVGSLTEEEVSKIEDVAKKGKISEYLLNRRKDFETGESTHLVSADLELKQEFDIKRLKKIKAYRGLRHLLKLPLRGQRTKSNFRRNRKKGSGIKKKGEKK